jgi:hypothetical protein
MGKGSIGTSPECVNGKLGTSTLLSRVSFLLTRKNAFIYIHTIQADFY